MKSFTKLGINALAINADATTKAECETPKVNLWEKAALETCQVLLLSPEQLNTDNFRSFISNPDVRLRLALFSIDECHLVDEWGVGFRPAYQGVGFQRSWLPDWTAVLALTATLEPGRQTDAVAQMLGFYEGRYHLDRRDCAHHNVDIIIRPIQYTYTTQEFRDLDWLIPTTLKQPSDIEKTLIYCETIDLGHRLARYLCTLLPTSLRSRSHCVVRHIHSIRCPACKIDDTSSLYQAGDIRSTAIHIATDVLGVGMDMPDFDRVICFVTPPSAASFIQRIGRTSRGRGRHGVAYVYVRKSDLENAELYIRSATSAVADVRLLNEPNTPEDFIGRLPHPKAQQGEKAAAHKLSKWKICPSLRLILSSHALGNCIARQINIIYQNPGVDSDCGRCSSCRSYPIPEPRPKAPTSTMSGQPQQSPSTDNTPAYRRLTSKDVAAVTKALEGAARTIYLSLPVQDEFMFVGSASLLSPQLIQRVTKGRSCTTQATLELAGPESGCRGLQ